MGTKKISYYESLSEEMKIRYDSKIEQCGGNDPYTLKEKDLSVNREDFPEITLLDIGNYMIHSVSSYTKRSFKAYKSMEGYKFFESGFVLSLGAKKSENTTILRGKVRHSQRMNASPHKVWLLAKMDGEIICAHCTCIAGLSETCSHVGALCFAVMNISESSETTSVTELLCKWNVPKFQEVSMSSVRDMQWNSASLIEPTTSPTDSDPTFRAHCNSLTVFKDEDITDFLNLIHSDGQESALRTLLYPEEIRRASTIKDEVFLASLYSVDNKYKTLNELIQTGKEKYLQISKEDLKEISHLTVRKNKSKIWLALRRGRVTGCDFKHCCATNVETPSITTVNRIINPLKDMDQIPSIKYQRKNKKKALNCYLNQAFDENHENFVYKESGLVINAAYPYFAASTDGLVSCDCHGKGCVEIKCFKVLESCESFDILTRKPKNILNKVDDKFLIDRDHELYYKLQMQIHLSEVKYCELVIWSPSNTLILRVDADTEFWNESKEKALKFHQEVIMPELLGKFFTGNHSELHQRTKQASRAQTEIVDVQTEIVDVQTEIVDAHTEILDEESATEYYQLIGLEIELLDSEDE